MSPSRYFFYGLIPIVFFFAGTTLCAQPDFRQVSVKKLPFYKPVNCLLTDKTGFLWLGTEEGLYRYDGFEFSLINTISSGELRLSDPQVNGLLEDSLQNLWVATGNGVTIINPSRNQYSHLAVSRDTTDGIRNGIHSMVQSDQLIWLTNFQGSIYRISLAQVAVAFQQKKPFSYQTLKLPGIASEGVGIAAPNGGLWVHHHNQLIKMDSSLMISKKINVPENLCTFRLSADEQMVYAANNEGIFTCDVRAEGFTYRHRFSLPVYIQESRRKKRIQPNDQRDWWIYGYGGVFARFDPLTGAYHDLSAEFEVLNPEKYVNFLSLWQDQPNHVWIGRNDGLFEVTLREKRFQQLPQPDGMGKDESFNPRSIHTLRDSSLLIGSYTGFYRYYPNRGVYTPIDFYEPHNPKKDNPLAYDFFEQGDTVYIASESYGLLFYEPGINRLSALQPREAYQKLGNERAIAQWSIAVLKDDAGTVWLGTYGGLMRTNLADTLAAFRIEGKKVFANSWVNDLYEDRQHRLWVATSGGLYSIPPDRKGLKNHAISRLANLDIKAICPDADGTLWLATVGEGLKQYNPVSGRVQSYTLQDGLPSNAVMSILPDASGNLWLGTKYGLCYFNPKAKTCYNYFGEDGLPDHTFQHNAVGQDLAGVLYLGVSNGIVTVESATKSSASPPPTPLITKIVKHDGSENKTHTSLFSSFNQSSIHLDYQDTFFSIYFSVKELTGEKPQFSYLLEGVNQDWNYLGEQNSLRLNALKLAK
jgi:two-component system, sensor histidine kinase ChiS